MAQDPLLLPKSLALPDPGKRIAWGRLIGASTSLAIAELAARADAPMLVLAEDPRQADQLEAEIRYFVGDSIDVQHFVEWETLPWDGFSPHQDIISDRLSVLSKLRNLRRGIVIASAPVLMQKLPPTDYVAARSLSFRSGQTLPREPFIASLVESGYYRVPQVSEHGEFSVRGSLIDVFPMGSKGPIRIDFFDDDIETLREFSAETQLSGDVLDKVEVLPAREVPLDPDSIQSFRAAYRERFRTCYRQYQLSVPFMEQIFNLALRGAGEHRAGFTGQITSNGFMKREFGKKLVEEFLAKDIDLTHVAELT